MLIKCLECGEMIILPLTHSEKDNNRLIDDQFIGECCGLDYSIRVLKLKEWSNSNG